MSSPLSVLAQLWTAVIAPSAQLRSTLLLSLGEDLVGIALAAAAPLLLKDLVDHLLSPARAGFRQDVELVLFTLAWASPNLLAVVKLAHTSKAADRLHAAITASVLHRQLNQPGGLTDGPRITALLERTPAALELVFDGLVWRLLPLLLQTLATVVALSFVLPLRYVLLLALTAAAYMAVAGRGADLHRRRLAALQRSTLLVSVELADLTQNAERAIINGTVDAEIDRLSRFGGERAGFAAGTAAALVQTVGAQFLVLALGLGLLLVLAVKGVAANQLTVGGFVMAQAYAFRFVLPLGGLMTSLRQMGPSLETLADAFRVAGRVPYVPTPTPTPTTGAAAPIAIAGDGLRADGVSYRHTLGGFGVFDVDLHAAPGEFIAIVGANGAGKSTLARLLAGHLQPDAGRVCAGGLDLATVKGADRSRLVLFAPQVVQLFNRTLGETGLYPPAEFGAADLVQRLNDLAFDVGSSELDLDAPIGPSGAFLSGGQKQKLELARLSGTAPGLLVLDESTSAMDANSEGVALSILRAALFKTSILMVTHRRRVALQADRVLFLRQGRITGLAPDAELYAADVAYRDLWEPWHEAS